MAALDLTSTTGLGAVGYKLVGENLGTPYQQYRPAASATLAPLDASNMLGTIPVWPTVDPQLMASKAPVTPKPYWYAGLDPAAVQLGDYIVGGFGTFFLSVITLPAPLAIVFCNTKATIERPQEAAAGPSFRGGTRSQPLVVATQWPGFLALQTRRNQNEMHLPGAVKSQNATLYLPSNLPGEILAGDIVQENDTVSARWTVQGASLSPSGWQATLIQATA